MLKASKFSEMQMQVCETLLGADVRHTHAAIPHWEFCPKFLLNWLNQFMQYFEKVAILTQNFFKYYFFSAKTNEGEIVLYFENSKIW